MSSSSSPTCTPTWTIHDFYCGLGGWSCGVAAHLRSIGATDAAFHGYEMDAELLRQWERNVRAAGFAAVAHHVTIGAETADELLPEETGRLLVHFSPPCVVHSRARRTAPTDEEAAGGAASLRFALDAVVRKRYKRFSIENVATESVKRVVDEYTRLHPWLHARPVCAGDYGCASDRLRLFVAPRGALDAVGRHPTSSTAALDALARHGLAPPHGATHIRNANTDTQKHRPITGRSFTIIASHPLVWTDGRETVRCISVEESAALVGFPPAWKPNANKKFGMRGVGNAVAPCVAQLLAQYLVQRTTAPGAPAAPAAPAAPQPEQAETPLPHATTLLVVESLAQAIAGLKRRVDMLEGEWQHRNAVHVNACGENSLEVGSQELNR